MTAANCPNRVWLRLAACVTCRTAGLEAEFAAPRWQASGPRAALPLALAHMCTAHDEHKHQRSRIGWDGRSIDKDVTLLRTGVRVPSPACVPLCALLPTALAHNPRVRESLCSVCNPRVLDPPAERDPTSSPPSFFPSSRTPSSPGYIPTSTRLKQNGIMCSVQRAQRGVLHRGRGVLVLEL